MFGLRNGLLVLGFLMLAVVGCAAGDDDCACGDSSCDANTQTCEHVSGGVGPGVDFYSCIPLPTDCAEVVFCACLEMALRGRGPDHCDGSGRHLTVRIDVP
jgi:hypothetical protein